MGSQTETVTTSTTEKTTTETIADTNTGNKSGANYEKDAAEFETLPPPYEQTKADPDSPELDSNWVSRLQDTFIGVCTNNSTWIFRIVLLLLFLTYTAYFTYALIHSADGSTALIVMTCIVAFALIYGQIKDRFGDRINEKCAPVGRYLRKHWPVLQWFVYPTLVIALIFYLTMFVVREPIQLQSISGFAFFTIFIYLTSKHPTRVRWRPVVWGYSLQFIMAILVLRWEPGYQAVKFISDWITQFINFAVDGAATVFGDPFLLFHPFAFVGMPMLIYTGCVMSILYYYGITQTAATKMAWILKVTLDTTAIETLAVASNIFLHGMDTMMMLRHYLHKLTKSEFNCFLVGSHATIAGFIFGLFVLFGAPPQHLLTAAVMSAPATIAIAKLNWPETETSTTKSIEDVQLSSGEEVNVFEAAANGSAVAGKTVFTVMINYIAFLGLLAWINNVLFWVGSQVGFPELSFEWMCSIIMWPIALLMGVELNDCREVAKLVGIKVFASEVLAFQEIGKSVNMGLLSPRSEAICTYALSGFSSVSTLAVAVGVWNAVCPSRTREMASMMLRLLTEANISCFTTACIAGLFYSEDMLKFDVQEVGPVEKIGAWFLGLLPGYEVFMQLAQF